MRLHQLEITAFGPFADTVRVDFDELGADGLFLLHGRTGAGKTSILDAVAFALYGTVPGARADGRRLLSDHAPAGTAPQVSLEATIAGRRLRIVRSPDYERPKLRGTGTVKQNAKASLTWLDGSGEHLSRLPDIGEAVRRLLGMSAEQFFQVVLLPQGEFAKFLRADSEDRGKLLERLFDTTRFGSVERWFKDRRSTAAKRLEEQQRAVDLLLAKVSAAAGLEAGADAEPVVWAHRLRDDAAESRDLALAALDVARADDTRDRAVLAEATELRRCQERRARAVAELADLDAGAGELQTLSTELETARRAAPVVDVARDAHRAAEAAAAAHAAAVAAAAPLAADGEGQALVAELDGSPAETDRALIRPHEQRWSAEVVRLDALLEQEQRLTRLEADRVALQQQRRDLAVRAERIAAELEGLPGRRDAAEEAARRSERAAATLPRLEAELARATDALAAATELQDRAPRLRRLEDEVVALRDAHHDARTALLDVRERRIAGMAAELATDLVDGRPCVVCGATAHPNPARPASDTATKADEDAAREAEQRAAAELTRAQAAVADAANTVAVLRQRCGDAGLDTLTGMRAAAAATHAATAATAAERERHRGEIARLRGLDADLREQAHAVDVEAAQAAHREESAAAEADEIRTRITTAAGAEDSLAARRRRIAALAGAAANLLDARVRAANAATVARERAQEATAAAERAGFASIEQALSAVRPDSRFREIEQALRAAADRRAAAQAVLDDPDTARVGDDPVDLTEPEAAVTRSAAALAAAVSAASEAERRHADIEKFAARLEEEYAKLVPLRDEQAELAALADVVAGTGQNTRKMSLRSYVLAARLEEVAESASVRLRRMSGGRYEFVHTDAAGTHGKRGGLGLDIHDEYTGAVRSTKTLSGGESFQASLALALGLADVVAAESGGLVLDTMFIDEGFGTLDADALDAVMGVLDELRAGGRVVGVVSHVDEMRQRIPSRLHVVRGRTGSTVEIAS